MSKTSTDIVRILSGENDLIRIKLLDNVSYGDRIDFAISNWSRVFGESRDLPADAGLSLTIDAPDDAHDDIAGGRGSTISSDSDYDPQTNLTTSYDIRQGTLTFGLPEDPTADIPYFHMNLHYQEPGGFSSDTVVDLQAHITLSVFFTHFSDPIFDGGDPDIAFVHIDYKNDLKLLAPKLPGNLTPEGKYALLQSVDNLSKLTRALDGVNQVTIHTNNSASAKLMNDLNLPDAITPHLGLGNALIKFAVGQAEAKIIDPPPSNPISLTISVAAGINKATIALMERLAADPPDGNYGEVYVAPDWPIGDLPGASAAGNAFVTDSYKLLQDAGNMLAAAERYQGADLANDDAGKATQSAAFDAALAQYESQRKTLSNSLIAFLPEVQANMSDLDLANDTSLADAKAYLASLANPMTDDPLLAAWINSVLETYPSLSLVIGNDVQQALNAFATAQADPLSGSAFQAIARVAAYLATASQTSNPNDFNADHAGDILIQNVSSGQIAFANMAGGTFQNWANVATTPGYNVVGRGKIANDSSADVVVQNAGGQILYANLINGALSNWVAVANTPGWGVTGVADVNGDGFADIAIQSQSSGQIAYANMLNGAFQGLVNVGTTPGWIAKALADVNGDGFADVVIQSQSSGQIAFADMLNGVFQSWLNVGTTPGWNVDGAADINRDGFADVVIQSQSSGQIAYGDMKNGVLQGWVNVATTPGYNVFAIEDINGDGYQDIVVQATGGSGQLAFANMAGGTFQGWGAVPAVPGWAGHTVPDNDIDDRPAAVAMIDPGPRTEDVPMPVRMFDPGPQAEDVVTPVGMFDPGPPAADVPTPVRMFDPGPETEIAPQSSQLVGSSLWPR